MIAEIPQDKFRMSLIQAVPKRDRCPHLKIRGNEIYCGKNHDGENISQERRDVCDFASLQLWCLDKERYSKCIWHSEKVKFND